MFDMQDLGKRLNDNSAAKRRQTFPCCSALGAQGRWWAMASKRAGNSGTKDISFKKGSTVYSEFARIKMLAGGRAFAQAPTGYFLLTGVELVCFYKVGF